ncbi:MAG: GNAT family N-acetyltransferase, partial [Candidatus Omnitrophica bacterium]|nr:GNAT family N-acetyltransferase [Candidatus Omnitrophota bacterium]
MIVNNSAGNIFVYELFVRPEDRSTGIGTQLLTDLARNILERKLNKKITLYAGQNNPKAIRFYESLGFRRVAAFENNSTFGPSYKYEIDPQQLIDRQSADIGARLTGALEERSFPFDKSGWSGRVYTTKEPSLIHEVLQLVERKVPGHLTQAELILLVGGTVEELREVMRIAPNADITVVNLNGWEISLIRDYVRSINLKVNIRLFQMDASEMGNHPDDYKSESFDWIYAGSVDHSAFVYSNEAEKILPLIAAEEARLIRPGGIVTHTDFSPKKYLPALENPDLFERIE